MSESALVVAAAKGAGLGRNTCEGQTFEDVTQVYTHSYTLVWHDWEAWQKFIDCARKAPPLLPLC